MGHADYYKPGEYNVLCDGEFTIDELKQMLCYHPDTGRFEWLKTVKGTALTDTVGSIAYRGACVYREIKVLGKTVYAHRLAFFYMTGTWPKAQIDHIDGNSLNNSWVNLRDVDQQANCRNARKPKSNTSGLVGVFLRGDRFIANICVDYKTKYLGIFDTIFEAACARKAAELRYNFHPNHGR